VKVETITVNIIESLVIETSFAFWNSVTKYFRTQAVQNNTRETFRLATDTPKGRSYGRWSKFFTISSVRAYPAISTRLSRLRAFTSLDIFTAIRQSATFSGVTGKPKITDQNFAVRLDDSGAI
jgi:hypothetical protein